MHINLVLLVLLFLATILSAPATSRAEISTTNNFVDQAFNGAQAVFPIDLDQDGDIDIVGAGVDGNELAWWENNGAETFTQWTIDAAFNGANAVIALDMDEDGDLDILATGGTQNSVSWWENLNRDATAANTTYPRIDNWANQWDIDAAFNGACAVFAVDMDWDGDLDVLAASPDDDDVVWWENLNRDPTVPNLNYPAVNNWANQWNVDAAFDGANSVYALDIDHDGDIDVVATSGNDDDVSWWENLNIDETAADANYPAVNNWVNQWNVDADFDEANSVFCIDMDKDGDTDILATAGTADDLSWWENDGTPANNTWTEYSIDNNFNGAESVFAADLDFDGDPDVTAAGGDGNAVSWWTNDGTPKNGAWTETIINSNFAGASFVHVIDLDDDGDMDVTGAADTDDDIAYWTNTANLQSGNIGFEIAVKVDDYLNGAHSVHAEDLDRDGDYDLVTTARIDDDLSWWQSDGTPGNGGWTEYVIDSSFDGAYDATTADIDNDGNIDIVAVAFNDNEVIWLESDGTPTDSDWTKHTIDSAFDGASAVFTVDLDDDGDLDVLATAGLADDLAWWANDGTPLDGGWTKTIIDADYNGATDVHCADLDNDGDIDILATADVDNDVAWWENDGAETFTKRLIDDSFNGATAVRTSDIDVDGDLDVVACAYNGSTVSWWANDGTPGTGGWTEYVINGALSGASAIDIVDIDMDGDPDVVGCGKLADDVVWWENDGTPTGADWTQRALDTNFDGASSVISIDLDRDGYIDVLGTAESGDDVSWWRNGGAAAVVTPPDSAATPNIQVDFIPDTSSPGDDSTPPIGGATGTEDQAEAVADAQEIDVKCFIATAVFGCDAPEVKKLRSFRDSYLLKDTPGRAIVSFYYRVSPPVADEIKKHPFIKIIVRRALELLVKVIPS